MKNYNICMSDDAEKIIDLFESEGYECFAVGGAVRDSFIGKTVNDWDFATNASPDEIIALAQKWDLKSIPTGKKFGTITILINGVGYEVTTYRIEKNYIKHREPRDVVYTSVIKEDLARRDFTMNALAYSPKVGILDFFGGIEDIRNNIIRSVGDSDERFYEDALRMLRAIRFSSQLGFKVDKSVIDSITKNKKLVLFLSEERVREELNKILLSNHPSMGLKGLADTGLMTILFPELGKMIDFNQNTPHHDLDVFEHTISVVEHTSKNLKIRLAALLHDVAKPLCYSEDETGVGHFYGHEKQSAILANKFLKRLKYSNSMIESVENLVNNHMHVYRGEYSDKSIKKFVNRLKPNSIYDFIELQRADVLSTTHRDETSFLDELEKRYENIMERKEAFSIRDLEIDGNDLIELGFERGPMIGKLLKEMLDRVMERPELNTKNQLVELADSFRNQ